MSISAGELFVNVTAKTKGLTTGLKKATLDVANFTAKSTNGIKSWGAENKRQFQGIGLAVTAFATTGAIAFKKFSDAAIREASALEEATSKFVTVFGEQAQKMDGVVKELTSDYAMSTTESRKYLSSMQDLLVPMGVNADLASKLSTNMVKLSADLGSFNDMPTAQVMQNIQSAMTGEFQVMKKFGIVLNEATIQQEVFSMGLASTKSEITAAHKAQAAYNLIVRGSTFAIGDMARTQDSYANVSKKLTGIQQDFLAMVGKVFLPIATQAKQALIKWAQASGGVGQKAQTTALIIMKALKAVSNAIDGFKLLFNGVVLAVAKGIEKITEGFIALSGFAVDMQNKLGGFLSKMPGMIGGIGRAMGDIKKLEMPQVVKDFAASAQNGFDGVMEKTVKTNDKFNELIKNIESIDTENILGVGLSKKVEESGGKIKESFEEQKTAFEQFVDGMLSGWAEAREASKNFAAQGKKITQQFQSDWNAAIGNVVDLYIRGEEDKINIQAAAGKIMTNAAGNFAKQSFEKILPRLIDQIAVSLGMGAAFSGSKGAQEGGWQGALKDIGLFLGTGVAAMLAGRSLASKFHASGGHIPWMARHPDGGLINEGSFARDDVVLGYTPDARHVAMGGEYVINKKQTAKHFKLLDDINNNRLFSGGFIPNIYHADGGSIDASKMSLQGNTTGWKGLAESINIGGFATFIKEWAKDKNPYSAIGKAIAYYAATFGGGFTAKAMGNKFHADGGFIDLHYDLGDYVKKMANPTRRWNPKTLWEDTLDSWSYPIENAVKDLLMPGVMSHSLRLEAPEFQNGTGLRGKQGNGLAYLHDKEIVLNRSESESYRQNGNGVTAILNNYGTISSAQDEDQLLQRMADKVKIEIMGRI
jgi:hypothetical protein